MRRDFFVQPNEKSWLRARAALYGNTAGIYATAGWMSRVTGLNPEQGTELGPTVIANVGTDKRFHH